MKFTQKTPQLLLLYFGLAQERSVRKSQIRDELIRRGVSPWAAREAMERVCFAIGWAADNRIEEIDAQLDP